MPDSCEPTYGLLLSRRWLRVCEAVGDYSKDTYVIKDREGRNHDVPCEGHTQQTSGTPKVSMNPQVTNCMLEEELVAELELDNYQSFEDVVRQIAREARYELAQWEDSDQEDGNYEVNTGDDNLCDSYGKSESLEGSSRSDYCWAQEEMQEEEVRGNKEEGSDCGGKRLGRMGGISFVSKN
ncbi:hypothetical protein L873DRAFT_360897 [Choiromyces venosus 120613-1]|uniref:Uncharacterized protein n=1 Tax=Choiromyces venosus 120613-1 TaxID=1336337 RepID=A0A3N4IXR3_9PEZI|nr:hypothetical protein L873DRAFT_360897 [Choiromyces venosus 120613-1]